MPRFRCQQEQQGFAEHRMICWFSTDTPCIHRVGFICYRQTGRRTLAAGTGVVIDQAFAWSVRGYPPAVRTVACRQQVRPSTITATGLLCLALPPILRIVLGTSCCAAPTGGWARNRRHACAAGAHHSSTNAHCPMRSKPPGRIVCSWVANMVICGLGNTRLSPEPRTTRYQTTLRIVAVTVGGPGYLIAVAFWSLRFRPLTSPPPPLLTTARAFRDRWNERVCPTRYGWNML